MPSKKPKTDLFVPEAPTPTIAEARAANAFELLCAIEHIAHAAMEEEEDWVDCMLAIAVLSRMAARGMRP